MFDKFHFFKIFITYEIFKGSEKKIRSQQLTPKNNKKEKKSEFYKFHKIDDPGRDGAKHGQAQAPFLRELL